MASAPAPPLSFTDLMSIAQKNADQSAKKLQTQNQKSARFDAKKFAQPAPPPKEKTLSANVQKFLAKRKEEDELALQEAEAKRQRLLDIKATAAYRKGLPKRKKKLNQVKSSSGAGGVEQLVEDDYGYVSNHAAEFHKKIIEKYQIGPPVPTKSANEIPDPGEPASAAAATTSSSGQPIEPIKAKPTKQAPTGTAALNFTALLQLAEVASQENTSAVVTTGTGLDEPKVSVKEDSFEFGRPMTAKEKAAFLQEKVAREKIERGDFKLSSNPSRPAVGVAAVGRAPPIPRGPRHPPPPPAQLQRPRNLIKCRSKSTTSQKLLAATVGSLLPLGLGPPQAKAKSSTSTCAAKANVFTKSTTTKSPVGLEVAPLEAPIYVASAGSSGSAGSSSISGQGSSTPKPGSSTSMRSPHLSASKIQFLQRRGTTQQDVFDDDDDDEHDSELDDFIDDSELPQMMGMGNGKAAGGESEYAVSQLIRSITGYDKRKYSNTSAALADDECLESTVWEQMREEERTRKLGIKEDLEDIRREEEEKKQKAMIKLKKEKKVKVTAP